MGCADRHTSQSYITYYFSLIFFQFSIQAARPKTLVSPPIPRRGAHGPRAGPSSWTQHPARTHSRN